MSGTCSRCGGVLLAGASYCIACGAPVMPQNVGAAGEQGGPVGNATVPISRRRAEEEFPERRDEPPETLPTGSVLLVVKRGPNAGSRFLLDGSLVTVGRHPNSDIFLDDITVSRRHAELYRKDDTYLLRDVGSLNGTHVNREGAEEKILASGDEVQIGVFRCVYLVLD